MTDLLDLSRCTITNPYFLNFLEIFGIVCYFTNEKRIVQDILLAFIKIKRVYFGKQLITHIFITLDENHIQDRLGYFIINNATANNFMVSVIFN